MKYIDEFRNKELIQRLARQIRSQSKGSYSFMEVCGGHTAAIHRFGIKDLLPEGIMLISGPGCPVCVTGTGYIDTAIAFCRRNDVIVTTFGDMLRVPGSFSSMEKERAKGADVRVVLSATEALQIAERNPSKKVVFLAIGFETTAPGTAATIKRAAGKKVSNFYVLSAHKVMPPAMEAIIRGGTAVDGFICPGHVSAITGSKLFSFIPEKYRIGCVVSGFEPADIMMSVLMLIKQVNRHSPIVEIQYRRAVSENGNLIALKMMSDVFEPCDVSWRGLGLIKSGGLRLKKSYEGFDAEKMIPVKTIPQEIENACICGSILRGMNTPSDCPLFAGECCPENPVGACMVSVEGACNTWYRYRQAI
jgi:hydrogenase expression/formation protein HypD